MLGELAVIVLASFGAYVGGRLGRRVVRRRGYEEGFRDGVIFGRRGPRDLSVPWTHDQAVAIGRAFLAEQRRKADLQ